MFDLIKIGLKGVAITALLVSAVHAEDVPTTEFIVFTNPEDHEEDSMEAPASGSGSTLVKMTKVKEGAQPGGPAAEYSWNLVQDRVDGAYSIKNKSLGTSMCMDVHVGKNIPNRLQAYMNECQPSRNQGWKFIKQDDGNYHIMSNIRWEPAFMACLTYNTYNDPAFPADGIGFTTCGKHPNGQKWELQPTGDPVPK